MESFTLLFIACLSFYAITGIAGQRPVCSSPQQCEEHARYYLDVLYEPLASLRCQQSVVAEFEYNTDLNNTEKEQNHTRASTANSRFIFEQWDSTIKYYNYSDFNEGSVKRQLKFLNMIGTAALNETDLTRFNIILANMSKIYGTAKICPFGNQNCDLDTAGIILDPDIESIIAHSNNTDELAYVWKAWRDAAGKPIRDTYKEYIALSNAAAVANGLHDTGDMWVAKYETANFREHVAEVWEDVKELYHELYGYVRFRLRQVYPNEFNSSTDPIPAHILGNPWAQSWDNIYHLVIPNPSEPAFDVTDKLQEKFNSTEAGVREIFREANSFFTGLGLQDMSMAYGEKAMIVRPTDGREVVCHASAWDFCDGSDYRIKMCTNVNQRDYTTVHHELGHIQYYIMYKNLSITFRDGANPGFHEAIGDVMSLSVDTPKHMARLGYLDSGDLNETVTENFLMQKALEKIAFLPFGYLIDVYRWNLFNGSTSLDEMELEWIKLRNEIQGIRPPVIRSENDFDAGSKYHVPSSTPYIRYFVSFILQFQFHKTLCLAAGEYDPSNSSKPLYNCDIAGNAEAGRIMRILLEKGFSENWQDVMEAVTGARDMDGSAIKEYFEPLRVFLRRQQQEHGYPLDWKMDAYRDYYLAA